MNFDFAKWMNPATYGMDTATAAIFLMVFSAVWYKMQGWIVGWWNWIKTRIYVQITVSHLDETFAHLDEWIQKNIEASIFPVRQFSPEAIDSHEKRSNGMQMDSNDVVKDTRFGGGTLWLRTKEFPLCIVLKSVEDGNNNATNDLWRALRFSDKPGSITIRFFGFSREPIIRLMAVCHKQYYAARTYKPDRIFSGGGWGVLTIGNRSWDSVILPEEQKETILDNVTAFFSDEIRALYTRTDIPYRRCLLLSGPPGTGKTTLIRALRTATGRQLYIMNLSSIFSDDSLLDAFHGVESGSIVVLEDIDAVSASVSTRQEPTGLGKHHHEDKDYETEDPHPIAFAANNNAPPLAGSDPLGGITLGGLLNVLDGVATPQGMYVIMTTNHPDKLDPALIRDGRVDLHEKIKHLDAECQNRLFCRIMEVDYTEYLTPDMNVVASEIQGACLRALLTTDNKEAAIEHAVSELQNGNPRQLTVAA